MLKQKFKGIYRKQDDGDAIQFGQQNLGETDLQETAVVKGIPLM